MTDDTLLLVAFQCCDIETSLSVAEAGRDGRIDLMDKESSVTGDRHDVCAAVVQSAIKPVSGSLGTCERLDYTIVSPQQFETIAVVYCYLRRSSLFSSA